MGMKVKLSPSFLSPKHYLHSSSPAVANDVFKTLNSVYFDKYSSSDDDPGEEEEEEDNVIESIIRGARSGTSRLLFEPSTAKAISDSVPAAFTPLLSLPESNPAATPEEDEEVGPGPFKESVVMAMESEDPYMDFRRSMEEMMETHHGLLKDWGCLEDLLAWYLKVNGKTNHAYIVAAFVDLLVKYSSSSSSSSSCSGVLNSPKLNHQGCSSSSCSTSRSSTSRSTSCACVCGDHHHRLRPMGNKSTTSFSSAASSFSNCDVHD